MKYGFTVVLALLVLAGCNSKNKKQLPESKNTLGVLTLVSDANTLRESDQSIFNCFRQPVPYLGEAYFEVQQPDIRQFEDFFTDAKVIFVLVTEANKNELGEVLESFSADSIKLLINNSNSAPVYRKDLWAKHQHIGFLFGKDAADISQKLTTQKDNIISSLTAFEISDQKNKLSGDTASHTGFYDKFRKRYGIGVDIPASFKLMKEQDGFYWFQQESANVQDRAIGLIVHGYPYKDSIPGTDAIIAMRDSFTKLHIPFSEVPGTYMSTSASSRFPKRFSEQVTIGKLPATRVRGWWTVKGATDVNGPFVRYVVPVPGVNEVFVFEGFVYKPNTNSKLPDLRLVEAIAESIH